MTFYGMDSCWSLSRWIPSFAGMTSGAGITLTGFRRDKEMLKHVRK